MGSYAGSAENCLVFPVGMCGSCCGAVQALPTHPIIHKGLAPVDAAVCPSKPASLNYDYWIISGPRKVVLRLGGKDLRWPSESHRSISCQYLGESILAVVLNPLVLVLVLAS